MPRASASRGLASATGAPAERHLAAVRAQAAREDVEQRRFSGAVLADDRVRLAARDRERDVAQRGDGAERLVDVLEGDGVHAQPLNRWGGRP